MPLLELYFARADITSPYGPRPASSKWPGQKHAGIDCGFYSRNRLVRALGAGRIASKVYTHAKGYQVSIVHGRDHLGRSVVTRYHMLSRESWDAVRVGDDVGQGEAFAEMATVGYSPLAYWSFAHVHIEVWIDGVNVSPLGYIDSQPATTPAGSAGTQLPTLSIDLPEGDPMKLWTFWREAATGKLYVNTGRELVHLGRDDYIKLRDLFRIMGVREPGNGWVTPPDINKAAEFFNLDAHGFKLLAALTPVRKS